MWTTIEIPDALRAPLFALAERRGEGSISRIVEEALRRYLDSEADRTAAAEAALSVLGTMRDADAEALRRNVDAMRNAWRV